MVDRVGSSVSGGDHFRAGSGMTDIRAIAVSPGPLERMPLAWQQAVVSARLPDGSFVLRSDVGDVTVRLPEGLSLRLGTSLTLRLDGTVQILIRAPLSRTEASFSVPTPAAASPPVPTAPAMPAASLPPALLVAAPPVRAGMAPFGESNSQATQSLLALLPHVGSGSFSLAAALYPQILRTGEMSRLLRQTREPHGIRNAGRLVEQIEAVATAPGPRAESDSGWLGWQLPFWDGNEMRTMSWLYRKRAVDVEPQIVEEHQALVELHLSTLGRTQIQCFVSENIWHFRMVSSDSMPAIIRDEIRAALHMVADMVGIACDVEFLHGQENFVGITSLA